jgi:hypothetical protein
MRKRGEARLALAEELLCLGISSREVAQALGVSEGTINADAMVLRRRGAFPEGRSRKKDTVFGDMLHQYAYLKTQGSLGSFELKLCNALARCLCEERILAFLEGLDLAARRLVTPLCPPDKERYIAFLKVTLTPGASGAKKAQIKEQEDWCWAGFGQGLWKRYLHDLVGEQVQSPTSRSETMAVLTERHLREWRDLIAPIWPKEVFEEIEAVLCTLTPRDEMVIRYRFGLYDGPPLTLQQVAELPGFGVHQQRIGQIEAKAFRTLRHPSRSNRLKPFIEPVGDGLTLRLKREAERKAEEERRVTGITSEERLLQLMLRPLYSLDLPTRTLNSLSHANVHSVGDLIQKRRGDLLETRNFGEKGLEKVEVVLQKLGLELGTQLDPGMRERLQEAYRAKLLR